MGSAMSISASGLAAASLRLQAAASNIVNADSSAYQPVSQVPAQGGVNASLQPVTALLAYNPAYAHVQGMVAQPNVDLPAEIVNMKEAANSFRASLAAYKFSSQMFKALLDATA